MKRRDFLKVSGGLSAHLIVGGSLLSIRKAEAQTGLPIAALQALLDPKKDMVLVPTNKDFSKYNRSFNKRTQIAPRVRVVAGSAKAVSTTMLWAANNGLSFAVRSGGHSYEGFSQSPDLVIDVADDLLPNDRYYDVATQGPVTPAGTRRQNAERHRPARIWWMRRLDPLFAAKIASIRLADAEIKAHNLRIMCGE